MSMQLLTYLSGGLPGLILSAGTGAVFLYGGLQVIHGTLTLGTFVAYMTCQMRFLPPMQALMGLYANLATARVSLRRVSEILDVPVEVEAPAAPVRLPSVRGDIVFENVSLSFDRGTPVLEQLSFAVRAGEVLAIVGASGSGKSTIADLLLRLVDPDAGVVRVDGHDLRSVDLTDLRRHVALVDQQPVILHATVAENIRYARPEASDAEVVHAAREAALDGFIDGLPQKYDTIVGERGAALSVGRAAAPGDGAGISHGSGGAGPRRAERGARPVVRTAHRRRLRERDAGADDHRDHASPRPGAQGGSDRRPRRRTDCRARGVRRAAGAQRTVRRIVRGRAGDGAEPGLELQS